MTLALGIINTTTAPAQVALYTLVGCLQVVDIDKPRDDGVIRVRSSACGVTLVRSGLAMVVSARAWEARFNCRQPMLRCAHGVCIAR